MEHTFSVEMKSKRYVKNISISDANLAEVTVTSFDKPDGIELEVTWQTTIS